MPEQQPNHNPTRTTSSSSSSTWGTWEELLLACAVKRHGFKNWDTVSLELQSRTSLPRVLTSARHCQQKYHDLHRRFTQNHDAEEHETETKAVHIPWLEELRKLRVAELKQEVQRYDVSILSLQLKVKRLEEEREKTTQENHNRNRNRNDGEGCPDLDRETSHNDKPNEPDKSDRENRSVNESNSTGSQPKVITPGEEQQVVKTESEPRQVQSGSNSKEEEEKDEEEREDSVQSSASLGRKRKRKGRRTKEVGGGRTGVKSEPLVGFLDMIRSHQHFSLLQSRFLQSQDTEDYKNTIRQHLDLETIQTRLDRGAYSSSNLSFYRDLLLLFNNAIVFFSKSSVELEAAHQLRSIVSNEVRKQTQKSDSTSPQPLAPKNAASQPKRELEISDSLLALNKSSAPLIVCRKRSSLSTKPSSSSSVLKNEQQKQQSSENKSASDVKQPVVEQSLMEVKSEEKPVTGARSSRRNVKNPSKAAGIAKKKQNATPTAKAAASKPETPKTDKKKTESLPSDKKRSAADFLKRIKRNSPVDPVKKSNNRGGANSSTEPKTDSAGKGQTGKDRVLRKSGDRKPAKEENTPSKKNSGNPSKKVAEVSRSSEKRGREGSVAEAKRPRKRTRR